MSGKSHSRTLPIVIADGRSYDDLRKNFLRFLTASGDVEIKNYASPEMYDHNRVTYIIPPVTDIRDREQWKPSTIYVVKNGTVAIGRVFYTRTSGEYLMEELILGSGDIFGEFEVPLSMFGDSDSRMAVLPPRFNMTYGAWASGAALNWAMSYPRFIPRDSVAPESAKSAVHPFYIKSKNIRPKTGAEIFTIPIERFEEIIGSEREATSWFLMNVLRKTRLYFEPPSQGYGRSAFDIVGRLIIRILAHRIRLGIVVSEPSQGRHGCRTFIGPTEWIKYGLGAYTADLKEVIQATGGTPKEPHDLPVFADELADILHVTYHFPVKDLDDRMLLAMGCNPKEDRHDNRYGLLTGIRIELDDLDFFMRYLLERGE